MISYIVIIIYNITYIVIGTRSQSRSGVMVYLHRAGVGSQFWSPPVRSAASITYSGQLNPGLLSNFPEQRNFNLGGGIVAIDI